MKIGNLEIDLIKAAGKHFFPELIYEDGSLALDIHSYRRSTGNIGSFTDVNLHRESILQIESTCPPVRFWFASGDISGIIYFMPGELVTVEVAVDGYEPIPSFDTGYEIVIQR